MRYVMVIQDGKPITSGLIEGDYIVREFEAIPKRPTDGEAGTRYDLHYNESEDRLEWVVKA